MVNYKKGPAVKRKEKGFTPLEMKVFNRAGNWRSRRFLTGFTIVELLTVLAIIMILVGLLIPSLRLVRRIARETKQKAQLATIDMALMAFRNDYGQYPQSYWHPIKSIDYCGAQKLAEALLGQDLMGFHPGSNWRADGWGVDRYGNPIDCYPQTQPDLDKSLEVRVGPYIELATANAFRLGNISAGKPGLFNDTTPLEEDTFVLCDVFGVRRITLVAGKTVRAGTPILYYRANTSSKNINAVVLGERIYNAFDNQRLLELKSLKDDGSPGDEHPLAYEEANDYPVFYNDRYNYGGGIGYGIKDPKVTARDWPYRPDSYILISAGADGLYGTSDDITNFGN